MLWNVAETVGFDPSSNVNIGLPSARCDQLNVITIFFTITIENISDLV